MVLISLFNFLGADSGVSKSSLNYIQFNKSIKKVYLPINQEFNSNNKIYVYFNQKHKIFGLKLSLIKDIVSQNKTIIIDGNSAAFYLMLLVFKIQLCKFLFFRRSRLTLNLRTHNLDIDVRFNLLKKIITYFSEYVLYSMVTNVSVVSNEDKLKIKKYYGVNALIIPNKINLDFLTQTYENKFNFNYVTFMGSTKYYPNFLALDFLYENILDFLRSKDYYLIHCGDGENFIKSHSNLIKVGNCSNPDFYSTLSYSKINLVPVELGGGTKIKLLESLLMGVPTLAFDNLKNNIKSIDDFNPVFINKYNFINKLDDLIINNNFFKDKAIDNAKYYKNSISSSNNFDF